MQFVEFLKEALAEDSQDIRVQIILLYSKLKAMSHSSADCVLSLLKQFEKNSPFTSLKTRWTPVRFPFGLYLKSNLCRLRAVCNNLESSIKSTALLTSCFLFSSVKTNELKPSL